MKGLFSLVVLVILIPFITSPVLGESEQTADRADKMLSTPRPFESMKSGEDIWSYIFRIRFGEVGLKRAREIGSAEAEAEFLMNTDNYDLSLSNMRAKRIANIRAGVIGSCAAGKIDPAKCFDLETNLARADLENDIQNQLQDIARELQIQNFLQKYGLKSNR